MSLDKLQRDSFTCKFLHDRPAEKHRAIYFPSYKNLISTALSHGGPVSIFPMHNRCLGSLLPEIYEPSGKKLGDRVMMNPS